MNEMIVTDKSRVIEITCDQDVEVPEGKQYHATELINFSALVKPREYDQGLVEAGKRYNVKVLAIITELPPEDAIDEIQATES